MITGGALWALSLQDEMAGACPVSVCMAETKGCPQNVRVRSLQSTGPVMDSHESETGRIRFRRVWFQSPNSVSVLALAEFREKLKGNN